MFPKTPLQQLLPQRLTELRSRIHHLIWEPVDLACGLAMTEPRHEFLNQAQARDRKLTPVNRFPFVWGRKFQQAWFKLDVPKRALKEGYYMLWDDEGEATLYVDKLPWYGFDAAHHRAPLPRKAREIWVEGTCVRTGVWFNDGKTLGDAGSTHRGVSFWRRNEAAWETYWDLNVLVDVLEFEYKRHLTGREDWNRGDGYHQPVFNISPLFRRILQDLDAFADRFDHEGFKAAKRLKAIYRNLPADSASLKAVLTGHAHIDLVWLWPERIGDSKAVHTFSTANRLMELYPEFRFGYSQPASYDAVARRSPELMKAVREKIGTGQWEATGGSDVEADTQLPCGEALARGFVIGQERFTDLRGTESRVLWLPDVFGYSPCMPQILRQAGVSWFFTTKLTWGTVTRFPYSSFRWIGHDGSEVLVHVSQEAGYNGEATCRELSTMEHCQQQAGVHHEFLAPTGYGDGGGGPTPEILERARRLRNLCGMPRCEWGRIEDFFERMEPLRERLPAWRGELYLEYHRGVHTTHGAYKAAFRAAERGLQAWEAANSLNCRGPVDTHAWRRLVFCQFHDAIPGSSIREVYEEQGPELEGIARLSLKEARAAFGRAGKASLFNPLALPRKVLSGSGILELEPLGCPAVSAARPSSDTVVVTEKAMRNGRLAARFNASGEISSLVVDGRKLALTGPGNQLWLYPEHPHAYPAWDIDRPALGNGTRVRGRADVAIEEASPLKAVLAFTRNLTEKSRVTVRYILEAESPVLSMEWEVDWQDTERLLKSVFETAYNGKMARYGAPFGSTLRPQHPGEPRAEAMWEVPASRWAVLSDDGEQEGLSLVTEAKYGFSARSGTIGLSLIRSAFITRGDEHMAIRDMKNRNPFSDIGRSVIRGAVAAFHDKLPRTEQPASLAESLYQPPIPVSPSRKSFPFRGLEGGESLVPVWVQPLGEGACVIRLNETLGRRGRCRVHLDAGVRAEVVDLQGKPFDGASLKNGILEFGPYALFGLRLG